MWNNVKKIFKTFKFNLVLNLCLAKKNKTKLTDKTGTNSYGATVTYRVYKSNAPAAFTNNSLVIS